MFNQSYTTDERFLAPKPQLLLLKIFWCIMIPVEVNCLLVTKAWFFIFVTAVFEHELGTTFTVPYLLQQRVNLVSSLFLIFQLLTFKSNYVVILISKHYELPWKHESSVFIFRVRIIMELCVDAPTCSKLLSVKRMAVAFAMSSRVSGEKLRRRPRMRHDAPSWLATIHMSLSVRRLLLCMISASSPELPVLRRLKSCSKTTAVDK